MRGIIASDLDGVQFLLVAFFIGFFYLIYYLRREDKREGYPLRDISPTNEPIEGFPEMPPVKTYRKLQGGETQMPHRYEPSRVRARRILRFPGAPLVPVGEAMQAEVGPGAYPMREDEPLVSYRMPQLVPLRHAPEWKVVQGDPDPRGMPVYDPRHTRVGIVVDLWADRGVKILRYLEVELLPELGGRHVLMPVYHADFYPRAGWIRAVSLLAPDFANVPALANPDEITAREEDRINAYFASGYMFSREGFGSMPATSPTAEEARP